MCWGHKALNARRCRALRFFLPESHPWVTGPWMPLSPAPLLVWGSLPSSHLEPTFRDPVWGHESPNSAGTCPFENRPGRAGPAI